MGGGQGRESARRHLERSESRVSPAGRSLFLHADGHAESQSGLAETGRCGGRYAARGQEGRSGLSISLSLARHDGAGLRRGGRADERRHHRLVRRSEAARAPARIRGICLVFLQDKVRIVWTPDAGSYGRPGFDDVGADAMLLSQAVGKPVRVQWMRADATQWGPKGPAGVFEISAGLDSQGNVSGLQFASRLFSGGEINFIPTSRSNFLAAQLSGHPQHVRLRRVRELGHRVTAYSVADILASAHVVPSFHAGSVAAGGHAPARSQRTVHVVCRRVVHGRTRRRRWSRPHSVPSAIPRSSAPRGSGADSGSERSTGWEPRTSPRSAVNGDARDWAWCSAGDSRRHAGRQCGRSGSEPTHGSDSRDAFRRRARLRSHHQPGRPDRDDPGEYRADLEPHAARRSEVQRHPRHERRLGDVSDRASIGRAADRRRAGQSSRATVDRGGRTVDAGCCSGHCQRGVRCDWRPTATGAVHAGAGQSGRWPGALFESM